MKALLWKEWRENRKWAALPLLLLVLVTGLFGHFNLMDWRLLLFLSFVAALFGAALGFVQVNSEARGDRRALLLHRPVSHSRVFFSKTFVGAGVYLLGVGLPLVWTVAWSATPGHVASPFLWPMVLPRLADILTGRVYDFAGTLAAARECALVRQPVPGLAGRLSMLVSGVDASRILASRAGDCHSWRHRRYGRLGELSHGARTRLSRRWPRPRSARPCSLGSSSLACLAN